MHSAYYDKFSGVDGGFGCLNFKSLAIDFDFHAFLPDKYIIMYNLSIKLYITHNIMSEMKNVWLLSSMICFFYLFMNLISISGNENGQKVTFSNIINQKFQKFTIFKLLEISHFWKYLSNTILNL